MRELKANRTLVKSPPELWAECSDAASLARHLGAFGDIRITRLEPETAVAWEGERASGTVRLEPSGWGTRVVLTARVGPTPAGEPAKLAELAQLEEPERAEEPAQVEETAPAHEAVAPEGPVLASAPAAMPNRAGLFARLLEWFRAPAEQPPVVAAAGAVELPPPVDEPPPVEAPPPAAEEPPADGLASRDAQAWLTAALDSLGQAHHRPFSRA